MRQVEDLLYSIGRQGQKNLGERSCQKNIESLARKVDEFKKFSHFFEETLVGTSTKFNTLLSNFHKRQVDRFDLKR